MGAEISSGADSGAGTSQGIDKWMCCSPQKSKKADFRMHAVTYFYPCITTSSDSVMFTQCRASINLCAVCLKLVEEWTIKIMRSVCLMTSSCIAQSFERIEFKSTGDNNSDVCFLCYRKAGVGIIVTFEPNEPLKIEKVVPGGPTDQQYPHQAVYENPKHCIFQLLLHLITHPTIPAGQRRRHP